MSEQYCFFEDHALENFHPLTLTRPVYDLRVGILTLGEKWLTALGAEPSVRTSGIQREHLSGVFEDFQLQENQKEAIWINPRVFPSAELVEKVKSIREDECLLCGDLLIAARISAARHRQWEFYQPDWTHLKIIEIELPSNSILHNSWELFQQNGRQIRHDIELMETLTKVDPDRYPGAAFINPDQIYVEEGAVIEPGAMLMAEKGPIYIGKRAVVMSHAIIRSTSAICEGSVVKMGAKIYEDTTIGPVCKVGGEISNVIFHSYSNKAHDGYAGNSVFGQWCNLGADTNTSNLKNNYGSVKVFDWKTKREFDTGEQFIGTIMGDHSKTGINAMLNTGTMCGVCCNLFSDNYPPKYVPSFSWVNGYSTRPYNFDKAIIAMEKMMERRSVPLTKPYYNMMKAIFQSTSF